MIQVQYMAEPEIDRYQLVVSGHAGYAERGKDIVCAGVSALVYTLIARANRYASVNLADVSIEDDPDGGMSIEIYADDAVHTAAREMFSTVRCGLKALADKYPQYVCVREKGGEK